MNCADVTAISENQKRYEAILAGAEQAARRSGRSAAEITVIAVSKTVNAARVRDAYQIGWRHFGENRVQELVSKQEALGEMSDVTWHLIGQLQTNKVKDVLSRVAYIHSLDRLSLAQAIQKRAEIQGVACVKCFVEVNVANEPSKTGLSLDQVEPFVNSIGEYPSLQLVGLMTVAPLSSCAEEVRPFFRKMSELQRRLQAEKMPFAPMMHLSMGMTADYEVAVEEGADFIRLGTAVFGARS